MVKIETPEQARKTVEEFVANHPDYDVQYNEIFDDCHISNNNTTGFVIVFCPDVTEIEETPEGKLSIRMVHKRDYFYYPYHLETAEDITI